MQAGALRLALSGLQLLGKLGQMLHASDHTAFAQRACGCCILRHFITKPCLTVFISASPDW